jgi:hypothetical protein
MESGVPENVSRNTHWKKFGIVFAAGALLAFLLGRASRDQAIVVKPSAGASALASEVLTALRAPPPSAQWLLKERMAEDILKASQQLRRMGL